METHVSSHCFHSQGSKTLEPFIVYPKHQMWIGKDNLSSRESESFDVHEVSQQTDNAYEFQQFLVILLLFEKINKQDKNNQTRKQNNLSFTSLLPSNIAQSLTGNTEKWILGNVVHTSQVDTFKATTTSTHISQWLTLWLCCFAFLALCFTQLSSFLTNHSEEKETINIMLWS